MRVVFILAALFIAAPLVASRLVAVEVYGDYYPDGKPKSVRSMHRTDDGELENQGPFISYYNDGQIETRGQFEDGMREGPWTWYNEDGSVKARCDFHADQGIFRSFFRDGKKLRRGPMQGLKREGLWTEWYPNGNKRMQGHFLSDQQNGMWTYWAEDDSTVSRKVLWDHGKQLR